MDALRKLLGIVWMIKSVAIAYFGFTKFGYPKLTSGKQEDLVFGIIIVFILLPIICGGLFIFGKYAYQNEYDLVQDAPDHAHYKED